jgi:hypothetical protein
MKEGPMIPAEPLHDVFTPEVIDDLRQVRSPSDRLRTRLAILHAGGLNPSPLNRELWTYKAPLSEDITRSAALCTTRGI